MFTQPDEAIPPEVERYFDYNATTPIHPKVVAACHDALFSSWGNASSTGHVIGRKAKETLELSRKKIADCICCDPNDLLLTSGGTEASNLVVTTVVRHFEALYGKSHSAKPHFVVGSCEHPALMEPLRALEREGTVSVTVVPLVSPSPTDPAGKYCSEVCPGAPNADTVVAALKPETVLVSVMLVNNETGAIADIAAIVAAVEKWDREQTLQRSPPAWRRHRVYVHSDVAQAVGKVEVDLRRLRVDYATIVGHKFYAPRAGALFSRGLADHPTYSNSLVPFPTDPQTAPLYPNIWGGGQERGYRSGTENVGMAAGLGEAAWLVSTQLAPLMSHLSALSTLFIDLLQTTGPSTITPVIHHLYTPRAPNVVSFSLVETDILDAIKQGRSTRPSKLRAWHVQSRLLAHTPSYIVARGAACHSGGEEVPSATIMAVPGMAREVALNTIRWSVGWWSKEEEVRDFARALLDVADNILSQE
ncbi:cysteine desulfurase [Gonapodya prolifera JEL478]|uniref:Selenocysteine lyase n=1 Tax=Gonapodya prolifera (strain JEL478) TaxID=1344416 RepID=A0A139AT25_GONPJ|nr:cysteine desulfurase [Gonapodya prolifera JEL478]|eukprot:KXS19834.1 cysteine desulfurase [Gonapodya prolifera JEL478]